MALGLILLNAALMVGVVVAIAGGLAWAIMTQHRDHGVVAAGPLFGRWVWSRSGRTAGRGYRREPQLAW